MNQFLTKSITYNQQDNKMSKILEKTMGEQSGSAKNHLDSVEKLCQDTLSLHEQFNADLSALSAEISILREKVRKNPHELRKFFVEKYSPINDMEVVAEESQRTQNRTIQEQMTEIKRENRETGQAIVKTFEKLKYLDQKIGQYR